MKRNKLLLFLLLAVAAVVCSCHDDNEDVNAQSQTAAAQLKYTMGEDTILYAVDKGNGEAWITYDHTNPLHLNSSNAAKITTYVGKLVIPDTIIVNQIPYIITGVDEMAFANNNTLTSVTLPDTVRTFGEGAFVNCTALTTVNIPEGTQTIPSACFGQCKKIKELTLPSTITTIGRLAFVNCSSLTKLHIKAATPPTTDPAAFTTTNLAKTTLYVPKDSKALYEENEVWKQCKAIKEE